MSDNTTSHLGKPETGPFRDDAKARQILMGFANIKAYKEIPDAVFFPETGYAVIRVPSGDIRVFKEIFHDADLLPGEATVRHVAGKPKPEGPNRLATGFKAGAYVELQLGAAAQRRLREAATSALTDGPEKGAARDALSDMLPEQPKRRHLRRDASGAVAVELIFPGNAFTAGDVDAMNRLDSDFLTHQTTRVKEFLEDVERTVQSLELGEHRYLLSGNSIGSVNSQRAKQLIEHECIEGVAAEQTPGTHLEPVAAGTATGKLAKLAAPLMTPDLSQVDPTLSLREQLNKARLAELNIPVELTAQYLQGNTSASLATDETGTRIMMRHYRTAGFPNASAPPSARQEDVYKALFPEYDRHSWRGFAQNIVPSGPGVQPHLYDQMPRYMDRMLRSEPHSVGEKVSDPVALTYPDATQPRAPDEMDATSEFIIRRGLRSIGLYKQKTTLFTRIPEEARPPVEETLRKQMEGCKRLEVRDFNNLAPHQIEHGLHEQRDASEQKTR